MNKLGFGFLRLPKLPEGEIHWALLEQMVDAFLAGGGTYFDTAYTYLEGRSEEALRRTLVERHPRDTFQIADKLPGYQVKTPEDCETFFQTQLRRCGVEWFDVYMLHWLNPENYQIAQKFDEFGFLERLKAEGRAGKTGFSYHGSAGLLEEILTAHPEVDIVQLQINYLDWEDPAIEAGACYEVAQRHGKEVVVMEPVKGGTLANLPEEALRLLTGQRPEESAASWAIRFAQDLENVSIVLSGMNTMDQLRDNLRDMPPLTEREREKLRSVCGILNRSIAIGCTGCGYCVSHCPQNISIPDYFAVYNSYARHPGDDWKIRPIYERIAQGRGKASSCIGCGQCQANCPQNIPIPAWISKVANAMELDS